jgi:hypothetical protein
MLNTILILSTWIMKAHKAFYDQVSKTVNYAFTSTNRARLGFIATHPAGEWLDKVFMPVFSSYITAFGRWKDADTRNASDIAALEKAEAELRPLYETLRDILTVAPWVSDEDLVHLGLPARPTGPRGRAPIATKAPWSKADASVMRRVKFVFGDADTGKRGHPEQHGVEIIHAIRDTPEPLQLEELTVSTFATKPCTFEFTDAQRGKFFIYALRWENSRAEKGPFGEVRAVMIP